MGCPGHRRVERFRYGCRCMGPYLAVLPRLTLRLRRRSSHYGINNTISFFVSTAALHRSHSSTMASLQGKKDMRRADLSTCPRPPPIAQRLLPYTQPCIRHHTSRALTSRSRALRRAGQGQIRWRHVQYVNTCLSACTHSILMDMCRHNGKHAAHGCGMYHLSVCVARLM